MTVRAVEPGDLCEVTEKLNTFYREYNLYHPQTADGLAEWLARSPFETPYRHYLISVDIASNVLAGLAITEF